jgi:hypothetical protein
VPSMPKDWEQDLAHWLDQLERLHAQLRDGCLSIRSAVVTRDNPAVISGVKDLQGILARLREAERAAAVDLRSWGLLEPAETFSLAGLERRPQIGAHPGLGPRLARTRATARAAQRAAALNRGLIERLLAWLQREVRILLEPFMEPAGYGATGARRAAAPRAALLDRKG